MNKIAIALGPLAAIALVAATLPARAATPEDFDCSRKVVTVYRPGANWAQFRERLAEHLDFVKAQMTDKTMAYGSPMSDASGKPVGGLFIYNGADLDGIARLVEQDTFVQERIVTYSLARWGMCQSKAAVAAP